MDKINIIGPINNLGYGIHTLNMIKSLLDLDKTVYYMPISDEIIPPGKYYSNTLNKVKVVTKDTINKTIPTLYIFHLEHLDELIGSPSIVFAIFETTKLKQKAIDTLKKADIVLTTTELHKNILKENGINAHIVHEGVDPILFNNEPTDKYIDTNKKTYITVGKNELRKNTNMIIQSFVTAMQYESAALIAHTYNPFTQSPGLHQWSDNITNLLVMGFNVITENDKYIKLSYNECDIYLTKPNIKITDMKSLYKSADIGIQCPRGEGWGLPTIELLACGVPCILTNVMGHNEYIGDYSCAFEDYIIEPIGVTLANDGKWFHGDVGTWSVIDPDSVIERIEESFHDEKDLKKNNTISKCIVEKFNWNLAAESLIDIIS